ncbi:MAG: type I-E CRISPR-associated protein Cas6/Cse3/CasE [Methylocystis sp.]
MTRPLFFSRATLKSDPAIEALAPLLMPADGSAKFQADHRLVWSLFAGDQAAKRDFLFRRKNPGVNANRAQFFILSKRPPLTDSALFDVETKRFAPALAAGDRLGFSLYANPAVNRIHRIEGRKVTQRHDVVMDALSNIPPAERAERRPDAIMTAGLAWLEQQGIKAGFAIADAEQTLKIDGYDQFEIGRDGRQRAIRISVLTFDGFITVNDPETFMRELPEGFGRARAFGCGLMLIRRV